MLASHNASSDCVRSPNCREGGRKGGREGWREGGREGGRESIQLRLTLVYCAISITEAAVFPVGYLVACDAHTPPHHTGGRRPTGMEERGLSLLIL